MKYELCTTGKSCMKSFSYETNTNPLYPKRPAYGIPTLIGAGYKKCFVFTEPKQLKTGMQAPNIRMDYISTKRGDKTAFKQITKEHTELRDILLVYLMQSKQNKV